MAPRFSTFVILLLAGVSCSEFLLAADDSKALTACAAFAQNGYSATAVVEQTTVSLEIANPSLVTVSHLTLPLRYPMPISVRPIGARGDLGCALSFDHDSNLVAFGTVQNVGVSNVTRVQIGVAEAKTGKIVADFLVEPGPEFMPTSLAGFLGSTTELVVTGRIPRQKNPGEQSIGFASLLFDPFGKQVSSAPIVREISATDAFRAYADADHNRLWLFSCAYTRVRPYRIPICPITLTSLTGDEQGRLEFDPASYSHKRDDLWMWPDAFAAPSSDTILIGETVNGKDTVWRVDMQKRSIDRFVLPKDHWVKYNGVIQASLSPDGEVLALLIDQIELGFPYFVDNYVFKGRDIVVMQLRPFRPLARISHKHSTYTTGLAVDHRQGKASILAYREGRMERIEVREQSR